MAALLVGYGLLAGPRRVVPGATRRRASLSPDGTATTMPAPGGIGPEVLVLAGEIDIATAPALTRRLEDPRIRILDLRDVTFIDSIGLRTLILADRTRPGTGRITLRHPSAAVIRLLELAGLGDWFPIDTEH